MKTLRFPYPRIRNRWVASLRATFLAAFLVCLPFAVLAQSHAPGAKLPPPGFHHLHLNALDPKAAIEFYVQQFPSTSKSSFAGQPALKSGNVYVLFNKVSSPPPTAPQTAIWHFGWHVVDVRKNLEIYLQRKVHLLPLYTTEEGGSVWVSSDTWPGTGGTLGRTKAQIADAKANGVQPVGGAGFAYLQGPDGAIIEYQGNMPRERFNHVHMYQEDPYCAQLWYEKHLNASPLPGPAGKNSYSEANCKVPRSEASWPALDEAGMFRFPVSGVIFDDVTLNWYENPGARRLVSTRGHLADHIGLSVNDLNAWIAKLRAEKVQFLTRPYRLGDTRAVMIEGPSREAIELVEVK